MQVLAFSGSLRERSYNTALARAAADIAPAGVDVDLYDGLAELPPYDEDLDGEDAPASVRELRARIAQADALLFVTPEYNGSIPGVLKNAIDWASRPPRGYGAIWAQQDLRRVLGIAGARVIDGEVPVARAQHVFDGSGQLTDLRVAARLAAHLEALVAEAAPIAVAA